MDLQAYFSRIGFEQTKSLKPNLQLLEKLQNLHILSIPFENLDVINKIPIILDHELLFKKIVKNHRGGFCFEQNGLFFNVLKEIGYNVIMTEASVFIHRQNRFGGMRNHLVLIVRLDQDYLVDVGFGRSSRKPLPLKSTEIASIDGTFRVTKVNKQEYAVEYFDIGSWHVQYKFHAYPIELADFQENCDWIQTSSESMFTQGRLITQATKTGRITLEEDFIKIRDEENIIETPILDPAEFNHYFKQYFVK